MGGMTRRKLRCVWMTLTAVVCVSSLINGSFLLATGDFSTAIAILNMLCVPVSSGFLFADWRKWLMERSESYAVGKHGTFFDLPHS